MTFRFALKKTPYDESYVVGKDTRATTNFANFARDPAYNQQHIRTFLELVNTDLNSYLHTQDTKRYEIQLSILSISIHFDKDSSAMGILITETMSAAVLDHQTEQILPGPTGLNFSSYLRDYDFRILLPQLIKHNASPNEWSSFGKLHGLLTNLQFGAEGLITDPLAIAISIAQHHRYRATVNYHPILGREYSADVLSLTDKYFAKMGLQARFFKPLELPAPLAIYSSRSLDRENDIYLAALIAVMGNFQRIYRPEIYLSRATFSTKPGDFSQASLMNTDYDQPVLPYDRSERECLSDIQAQSIADTLVKPYGSILSDFFFLS
jgi:hypothetical protein